MFNLKINWVDNSAVVFRYSKIHENGAEVYSLGVAVLRFIST